MIDDKASLLKYLGALIFVEAVYSIAYSTDQFVLYTFGRLVRAVIGLGFVFDVIPKNYYLVTGAYLILEGLGSIAVSPDIGKLVFQAGWALRLLSGYVLVKLKRD